ALAEGDESHRSVHDRARGAVRRRTTIEPTAPGGGDVEEVGRIDDAEDSLRPDEVRMCLAEPGLEDAHLGLLERGGELSRVAAPEDRELGRRVANTSVGRFRLCEKPLRDAALEGVVARLLAR